MGSLRFRLRAPDSKLFGYGSRVTKPRGSARIVERRWEMGVATVQFYSHALGRRTTYEAILPDTGRGRIPVLLELHGLFDDHNSWIHKSKLVHTSPTWSWSSFFPMERPRLISTGIPIASGSTGKTTRR